MSNETYPGYISSFSTPELPNSLKPPTSKLWWLAYLLATLSPFFLMFMDQ